MSLPTNIAKGPAAKMDLAELDAGHRTSNGFEDVLRLRYWQHILNELLKRKSFQIPIHLAFGHEAAAVALDRVAQPPDAICLSHRNVAYNLARSKSLDAVLEHYRLQGPGAERGQMGSMNLAMEDSSIAYTSSILGNNLPVAAGIAMNRKLAARDGVVFVLTGDGAMEEGAFWETLIFARSHALKLVVIVENNDCSMSSTIAQRRSPIDLAQVCMGLDIVYRAVPGANLAEVEGALQSARREAGNGLPVCVELALRTFNQHAGPTPGWPDDPLHIALADGLMVREGIEDPVYNIRQALGEPAFIQLTQAIIEADGSDKHLH